MGVNNFKLNNINHIYEVFNLKNPLWKDLFFLVELWKDLELGHPQWGWKWVGLVDPGKGLDNKCRPEL